MLQDSDLRACPCGDVRELGGDIATSHENDAPGEGGHLKKALVVDQELLAGDVQAGRLGTDGDQDVFRVELLSTDLNCLWTGDRARP